jgi:ABC-type thiamine transport system ATPase subunit
VKLFYGIAINTRAANARRLFKLQPFMLLAEHISALGRRQRSGHNFDGVLTAALNDCTATRIKGDL